MCGISGFWVYHQPQGRERVRDILTTMNAQIQHRGPDEGNIYIDPTTTLGLTHRRFSIVDLSTAGAQPMLTKSERYVIVYNGELYNTEEIRQSLASRNIQFRGHSDTEVLIEAIEIFGIEATLKKLNGMFALAAYDTQQKTLYLARDQMGIKPLFWSYQNGVFLFGSELKPIIQNPFWKGEMNLNALHNFFLFNYIPGSQSIYKNTHKLNAGHYMVIKEGQSPKVIRYWSPHHKSTNQNITKENAIDYFESLLSDSIRKQMVADVPLGVFLSGGIDSSLIAALMQKNSSKPIKTFTIGFEEDKCNESHFAKNVAQHIGSDHYEEILSVKYAQDLISTIPDFYDEPFADSSQLPSMLLCTFTKKHVTVALSGDGGDELFLGYSRYFYADKLFKNLNRIKQLPFANNFLKILGNMPFLNQVLSFENFDFKLQKMVNMLENSSIENCYQELMSLWSGNHSPLLQEYDHTTQNRYPEISNISYMQTHDIDTYLPDDILQKMDRASMAYSLEARVPLLDIRLVQSALSIPPEWHIQDNKGKFILRSILQKYVPRHLFERPKQGFSVPIANWLRHDMRDLAESYLNPEALKECSYLDTLMISKRWEQHLAGTHNWHHSLWGVLMFQMWREKYKM